MPLTGCTPLIRVLSAAVPAGASSGTAAQQAPGGRSYPWVGCSNKDRREVDATEVSDADPGSVIRSRGEPITPDDKLIRQSPNGRLHWCTPQAGIYVEYAIRPFVPRRGA